MTYKQTGGGKTYNNDAYNAALDAYSKAPQYAQPQQVEGQHPNNGNYAPSLVAPKLEDFLISDAPPQFTSTIKLSPEQQALYDSQTQQQQELSDLGGEQIGRIRSSVATPYSYNDIGNEVRAEDVATAQARAEEALMSRLNPQFSRDEESVRSRLINQGIQQGSEAYGREMDTLGQAKNDARMQAILSAAGYGGELQNQALARRNQGIQEYSTVRNAPLNEYIGFTSGSQVQNPQFQNTSYGGAASPDYADLVQNKYNADMSKYNAKVAGNNSTMGSLFGLGGQLASGYAGSAAGSAAIGALFSDIRLKDDIKYIGKENGHNVYEFRYIDKPEKYIGVMAHEVEKTNPDAVVEVDGYKAVNYSKIGVEFRGVA